MCFKIACGQALFWALAHEVPSDLLASPEATRFCTSATHVRNPKREPSFKMGWV